MTLVAIKDIRSNPYRDFKLYPLDNEQIERLVGSIKDFGFFGGVKARRTDNGAVELGFGHHRIEAAKRAGFKEVDINIGKIDDDDMVRLMCVENATQRGAVAAAIMNEIAAATKRIAGVLLREDNNAGVPALFDDQKAFGTARGHLEKGDGVGGRVVGRYLRGARSTQQIQDAVASLKESGVYTKILREVEQEIAEEAEQAEREAEAAAKEKKAEAERKAADKRKAKERSKSTREQSEKNKKHQRIYDERCASVFETDSQHAAFKQAVTSNSGRKFIAVSQQYELAKQVQKEIAALAKKHRRAGAPFIRSYVSGIINEAINKQKGIDKDERERAETENQRDALVARLDSFLIHCRSMIKDAVKINEMLQANRNLRDTPKLAAVDARMEELMEALEAMWKKMK